MICSYKDFFLASFTLLLSTLFISEGVSQNQIIYVGGDEFDGIFRPRTTKINYDDIEGSPYSYDKLLKGFVALKGEQPKEYFLRYDIYAEEMEFLNGDQLLAVTNKQDLDYVQIANLKYIYTGFYINDKLNKGFLVELDSGKCSLYRKDRVRFEKEQPPKSSYTPGTPATFKSRPSLYFMSCLNSELQQFNTDNSALDKFPPVLQEDIKSYMKKNKLKFKKESDLIQVFDFINSQ